jgi:hypothetical protein
MADGFIVFCEELWCSWLVRDLRVSSFVHERFDLDAAPEPYVSYSAGQRPLVALLTNPGATMPHQRRKAVEAGEGPLRPSLKYATAAERLGKFYESRLSKKTAGRRITALQKLSKLLGCDGVLQVDAIPFHSASLPGKGKLLAKVSADALLRRYAEHVREFLKRRPVVVVAAVSTRCSLDAGVALSPWIEWQAELAGVEVTSAESVSLVTKGSKTTASALVSSVNGVSKVLVRMMGGNHLPGDKGLRTIADTFRRC